MYRTYTCVVSWIACANCETICRGRRRRTPVWRADHPRGYVCACISPVASERTRGRARAPSVCVRAFCTMAENRFTQRLGGGRTVRRTLMMTLFGRALLARAVLRMRNNPFSFFAFRSFSFFCFIPFYIYTPRCPPISSPFAPHILDYVLCASPPGDPRVFATLFRARARVYKPHRSAFLPRPAVWRSPRRRRFPVFFIVLCSRPTNVFFFLLLINNDIICLWGYSFAGRAWRAYYTVFVFHDDIARHYLLSAPSFTYISFTHLHHLFCTREMPINVLSPPCLINSGGERAFRSTKTIGVLALFLFGVSSCAGEWGGSSSRKMYTHPPYLVRVKEAVGRENEYQCHLFTKRFLNI